MDPSEPSTLDRRRFLLGAAGGVGALLLGACSGSKKKGGSSESSDPNSSSVSTGTDARTLAPSARPTVRLPYGAFGFPSPFSSNGGFGYIQMSLLYDTLLWKDGSGKLLPWLATRFDRSADDLTYTFELRPGLKWHDGNPLTADDVAFTFDYYAHQTLPPPVIIQRPDGVTSVRATSPTTVMITLTAPDVTFADQVAGALPIIPRHVWSSITDASAAQNRRVLVGSGPYRLESYSGDGGPLLYTAVDDYFLGAPYVKRIEFHEVDDEFTALLAGATDTATGFGVRSDVLNQFRDNASYGSLTARGNSTDALYWNLTKKGALADVRFRRACAKAINRQDLVDRLASGNGEPGNPGFLGAANPFKVDVEQYAFDVRGANNMLDSAGYARRGGGTRRAPDGSPLSFELLIGNTEVPLAELLKAALASIGVEITPKPAQIGPALFGVKLVGAYEMAVLPYPGPSGGGPNADPDLLRQVFSSKVPKSLTGATGYFDAKFDDLAARQRRTFDETARKELVAQMQHIVANDLPVLSLYEPEDVVVFRKQTLDRWYLTPGQFPVAYDNKQLFVTGVSRGTTIRPTR